MIAQLLHIFGVVLTIFLPSIGVGIGQGLAAMGGAEGIARQSLGQSRLAQVLFLGVLLIETAGILPAVVGISLLVVGPFVQATIATGIFSFSIGLTCGITGCVVAVASGYMVQVALSAMSRQPFAAGKISFYMLLGQIMLEAPVVFALVFAFWFERELVVGIELVRALQYSAAMLMIAAGAVGPVIAQSFFARRAHEALGRRPELYSEIFSFSLISQALIESPVVLSLVLSLALVFKVVTASLPVVIAISIGSVIVFLGGAAGASIGSSFISGATVGGMVDAPEQYGTFFRSSILYQAFVDTALVYSLCIALMLINKLG